MSEFLNLKFQENCAGSIRTLVVLLCCRKAKTASELTCGKDKEYEHYGNYKCQKADKRTAAISSVLSGIKRLCRSASFLCRTNKILQRVRKEPPRI